VSAFLWGLLSAASLVIGALVVMVKRPSERALGLLMGFGAGVLLSAVSFELVLEAANLSGAAALIGLFAGTVAFITGDRIISRMGYENRKDIAGTAQAASGLAITLGIVLDGIPESAVVGITLLTGGVSVSMLVAVFVSNLPESVAATASLRAAGWSWSHLLTLWGGIAVASGLAASAGYRLLSGASDTAVGLVLAFAGGAILAMLATTMMPEAYQHAGLQVGLATTLGFSVSFTIYWTAG
jgi:ZIP family zinc transporter